MTAALREQRAQVNWHHLRMALEGARIRRGMSLRAAAKEMTIPVSGLSRFSHGGRLSADALARLLAWLYPRSVPFWITNGYPMVNEEDE